MGVFRLKEPLLGVVFGTPAHYETRLEAQAAWELSVPALVTLCVPSECHKGIAPSREGTSPPDSKLSHSHNKDQHRDPNVRAFQGRRLSVTEWQQTCSNTDARRTASTPVGSSRKPSASLVLAYVNLRINSNSNPHSCPPA